MAKSPSQCNSSALDRALDEGRALLRAARPAAAARCLGSVEELGAQQARYWALRGEAERMARDLRAAQTSYDRALACDPDHSGASQGRARVALERGQDDAVMQADRALAANPDSPRLWRDKALALDASGQAEEARAIAERLVSRAPHWVEGFELLAQLRLGQGEDDFADHYAAGVAKAATPDLLYASWIRVLAGIDRFDAAARIAAEARSTARQKDFFALSEAVYAGMAGDDERAERLFATLPEDMPEAKERRARHDLRLGRIDRAEQALGELIETDRSSTNRWALRDVCWRLLDDPRHRWLHRQDGLVRSLALPDPAIPAAAVALLEQLHCNAAMPLGQSVRGGTQTRGELFQRAEGELRELRAAITSVLEEYRRGLPATDPDHPLLAQRNESWRIANSWSIRLTGAGFHTSHIHPAGILSSALYLKVPDVVAENAKAENGRADNGRPGHIEIGRPPADLRLDLAPLLTIGPKPGRLVLFPATLYHGTRPFAEGERLTVAFDVAAGAIP